jgi:hypothetical protein
MAIAGLLQPAFGTLVASFLAIPAIIVGGWGLPVPRSAFQLLPFVAKRVLGSLGCAVNVKKSAVRIENTSPNTGRLTFINDLDGL